MDPHSCALFQAGTQLAKRLCMQPAPLSLASNRPAPARRSALRVAPSSELRTSLHELRPDLLARAMRLTRSASLAEDVVQDTLERAMRFESHYLPGTNPRAWLFQILFSVFITRCRRARREQRALSSLYADPCSWTKNDERAAMNELSPAVRRALDALPEVFRQVVVLVDLEEMAYRDAASRLGVPVGTVMSRLHRARKQLAVALREVAANDDAGAMAA
jgi:RNA polymerase sigma-70 factor, ECF subfamily